MERTKRSKVRLPARYRKSIGEADKRSKSLESTKRVGGAGKKHASTYAERLSRLEQFYGRPRDSDELAQLPTGSGWANDDQLSTTDDPADDDNRVDEPMDDHVRDNITDNSDNDEERDSQVAIASNRTRSILNAAKESLVQSEGKKSSIAKGINDNSRRLGELEAKQNSIKESVDKILQLLSTTNQQQSTASTTSIPPEDIVNGIDVIHMPCRDAYQFGLDLLDMFFTPEELARSLVYKSKRSPKDGLDKDKVDRMMYLIKKRYKREPPDMKKVVAKMNQKCNDKKRELRKRRNIRPINEGEATTTPNPNPTTPDPPGQHQTTDDELND